MTNYDDNKNNSGQYLQIICLEMQKILNIPAKIQTNSCLSLDQVIQILISPTLTPLILDLNPIIHSESKSKKKCNLEKSKTNFSAKLALQELLRVLTKLFFKVLNFVTKFKIKKSLVVLLTFLKIQFSMDSGFHLRGLTALFIFSGHSVIQELLLLQIHKNLHGELQIVPIYPPCQMKQK